MYMKKTIQLLVMVQLVCISITVHARPERQSAINARERIARYYGVQVPAPLLRRQAIALHANVEAIQPLIFNAEGNANVIVRRADNLRRILFEFDRHDYQQQ